MIELTVWFRRVVWFLAFTAAVTTNPGLLLLAAALALVFELVYNVTNARQYWDTTVGYGEYSDEGNLDLLSRTAADYLDYPGYPGPGRAGTGAAMVPGRRAGLTKVTRPDQARAPGLNWRYLLGLPPARLTLQHYVAIQ